MATDATTLAAIDEEIAALRVQIGDLALEGKGTATLEKRLEEAEGRRVVFLARQEAAGRAAAREAAAQARHQAYDLIAARVRLDAEIMRRRAAVVKAEVALAVALAELEGPPPINLGPKDAPIDVRRNTVADRLRTAAFDLKDEQPDVFAAYSGIPECPSGKYGGQWLDEKMPPKALIARAQEFDALAVDIEKRLDDAA